MNPLSPLDPRKLDAVVLTLDSAKTLRLCLESLRSTPEVSSIIVVDGGSNDGTLSIARELADKIAVFPNSNIGEARDRALDMVDSELFIFVDSDVVVTPVCIRASLEMLSKDYRLAAVASKTLPSDPRLLGKGSGSAAMEPEYNTLAFGLVVMRSDALSRCRIPHLVRGEDAKTGERLERMGYKWTFQTKASSMHVKTVPDVWFHYFRYGSKGHQSGQPGLVLITTAKLWLRLFFFAWSWRAKKRSLHEVVKNLFFLAGYLNYMTRIKGRPYRVERN